MRAAYDNAEGQEPLFPRRSARCCIRDAVESAHRLCIIRYKVPAREYLRDMRELWVGLMATIPAKLVRRQGFGIISGVVVRDMVICELRAPPSPVSHPFLRLFRGFEVCK